MGDPTGFIKYQRQTAQKRPVQIRVKDWREVYEELPFDVAKIQGARCMDCGIPFCHEGCPLGNLIPEFNDLVYRGKMQDAVDRLLATNNFPEFTGRLCPAPCEGSCVLGINQEPVSIKEIEHFIADHNLKNGLIPLDIKDLTGKKVAIVGSGPAGLACAQQLRRAGHDVVVFERAEKPGGLLRYGIPEFKMEKWVLERRIEQMKKEGVIFVTNTLIGDDDKNLLNPIGQLPYNGVKTIKLSDLVNEFDAVVLAIGSTIPRDLPVKGRDLEGIYFAMQYLKYSNLFTEGSIEAPLITAQDKTVVIIGGGDTGADCLGTAHRQGAKKVIQLEILSRPPDQRAPDNPWPTWPIIFRTSTAHEEGGERLYQITTLEFVGSEGKLSGIKVADVDISYTEKGPQFTPKLETQRVIECELVLLAMGFVGPEITSFVNELNLEKDLRGNIKVNDNWMTSYKGLFACGDSVRGQSLIVWAIAEGRSAAKAVDQYLMGESVLPASLKPYQMAIR